MADFDNYRLQKYKYCLYLQNKYSLSTSGLLRKSIMSWASGQSIIRQSKRRQSCPCISLPRISLLAMAADTWRHGWISPAGMTKYTGLKPPGSELSPRLSATIRHHTKLPHQPLHKCRSRIVQCQSKNLQKPVLQSYRHSILPVQALKTLCLKIILHSGSFLTIQPVFTLTRFFTIQSPRKRSQIR